LIFFNFFTNSGSSSLNLSSLSYTSFAIYCLIQLKLFYLSLTTLVYGFIYSVSKRLISNARPAYLKLFWLSQLSWGTSYATHSPSLNLVLAFDYWGNCFLLYEWNPSSKVYECTMDVVLYATTLPQPSFVIISFESLKVIWAKEKLQF
jgi:hypothetical protein